MFKKKKTDETTGEGAAPTGPEFEVTPGEIVHYTPPDEREPVKDGEKQPVAFHGEVHAAMVTRANADGTLELLVHAPAGDYRKSVVQFSGEAAGTEAAAGRWTFRAGAHI